MWVAYGRFPLFYAATWRLSGLPLGLGLGQVPKIKFWAFAGHSRSLAYSDEFLKIYEVKTVIPASHRPIGQSAENNHLKHKTGDTL